MSLFLCSQTPVVFYNTTNAQEIIIYSNLLYFIFQIYRSISKCLYEMECIKQYITIIRHSPKSVMVNEEKTDCYHLDGNIEK